MRLHCILSRTLAILLLLGSCAAHSESPRDQPLKGNFNFLLEIEGVSYGKFQGVDGLSAAIEVVEFRDGGEGGPVRKLPGRATYGDITLKRGYSSNSDLRDWLQEIIDGNFEARNGSIVVMSRKRAEVARFNFINGWSRYRLGLESRKGRHIAIEELTLTVERIDLN